MAPFAGEENANEDGDAKTREKLAIEKTYVADCRGVPAISILRSWRLKVDGGSGERRGHGEACRVVAIHHAAPMVSWGLLVCQGGIAERVGRARANFKLGI